MDCPLDKVDGDAVGDPPSTSNRGDVNPEDQSMNEESNPQRSLDGDPRRNVSRPYQVVSPEGNDNSNVDSEIQFGSLLFRISQTPQIGESSMSTRGNEDSKFQFGSLPFRTVRNPQIGESSMSTRGNEDSEIQFGSVLPFRTVRNRQIGESSMSTRGNEDSEIQFGSVPFRTVWNPQIGESTRGNEDSEIQFGSVPFRTVRNPQIGESSMSTRGNEDAPCFSDICNNRGETTNVTIVGDGQIQHGSTSTSEQDIYEGHPGARTSMYEGDRSNISSRTRATELDASFNSLNLHLPPRIYAQNPVPWDPNPYGDGHPFSTTVVEGALSSTWNMVQSWLRRIEYHYHNDRFLSHEQDSGLLDIRILVPQTPRLHDTFREREISQVSILEIPSSNFIFGALIPSTGGNIAGQSNLGSSNSTNLGGGRYFQAQYMRSPHSETAEIRITQNVGDSSTPWSYAYSEHGLALTPSYWTEVPYIRRRETGSSSNHPPSDEPICQLCKRELRSMPPGAGQSVNPPDTAVLPCGHSFHGHCLSMITPAELKDPICIHCAGVDH